MTIHYGMWNRTDPDYADLNDPSLPERGRHSGSTRMAGATFRKWRSRGN